MIDKVKNFKQFVNENINHFDEDDVEKWMGGECIPFAVALNEIFPQYQIAVLNDEYDVDDEDIEYNFNISTI